MATARHLLALLIAAALIAACGADDDDVAVGPPDPTTDPSAADPIGESEWRLVAATVDGSDLELLASHPITLQRRGDEVVGTAACNGYSGALVGETSGPGLFGALARTEMACDPPESMTLEDLFLGALGRAETAARDGEALVLAADDVELRFEAVPSTPAADIEGTAWVLDTLLEGEAARSLVSGSSAGLRLEGGTISGTDGCNTFEGGYEVDGDALRVGPLVQTTRGCASDIIAQAQTIVSVLTAQPTISIDGDRLTLVADDGLGLVYRVN